MLGVMQTYEVHYAYFIIFALFLQQMIFGSSGYFYQKTKSSII